jgi:hypothetical protein
MTTRKKTKGTGSRKAQWLAKFDQLLADFQRTANSADFEVFQGKVKELRKYADLADEYGKRETRDAAEIAFANAFDAKAVKLVARLNRFFYRHRADKKSKVNFEPVEIRFQPILFSDCCRAMANVHFHLDSQVIRDEDSPAAEYREDRWRAFLRAGFNILPGVVKSLRDRAALLTRMADELEAGKF